MKTLQSNFTTPKQSKRLLELGVPADSADGILRHYAWADDILDEKYWESPMVVDSRSTISITELLDRVIDDEYDKALPCWSVGRLMEIIDICVTNEQSDPLTEEYPTTIAIMDMLHISYVEFLVRSIAIAKAAEVIDYSKLDGNK